MSTLARAHQLAALADAQAGYFSAAQALDIGYSYPAQHHHLQQGNWERTHHGLFRLTSYPRTPHEHLAELSLWSRNRQGHAQGVISHDTALAFHELSDLLPEHLHLTVPPTFRKVAPGGVVLHRGELAAQERQTGHGFQVTTVTRTLQDMLHTPAATEFIQEAILQAVERGLISPGQRSFFLQAARDPS